MNYKEVLKHVPRNYLLKWFYKKPNVMSSEETVDYIIKNKVSISRYGDGEICSLMGYNLDFQKANGELSQKLKDVKNTENCLVCLPKIFYKKDFVDYVGKRSKFWSRHLTKYEYFYKRHFKDEIYGDAFISRFYIRYNKKDLDRTKKYIEKLKQIWQDRDIVFIEGKNSRLGYGNDLFDNAKSIKRILAPAKNAFDKYNDIFAYVEKNIDKNSLLILALGPTATVMSYELSKKGFWALDLGHIDIEYEWFKMGATEKVPIPHKHVNEANSLGETEESELSKEYKSQILAKFLD